MLSDFRSARKVFDTTRLKLEQEAHSYGLDVQKNRRRYQEAKHAVEDSKTKYESALTNLKQKKQDE